ncbi:MAG: hypothetical protein HGB31_09345 [Erysipelotrichaceae bacterium]|nr:hypothetical protein [Erysipelotrichaceae bacterium]
MRAKGWAWFIRHGTLSFGCAFIFYGLSSLLGLDSIYLFIVTSGAFGLGIWISITEAKTKKHEEEFYMMIDFFQQVLALFKHHPKIYFSFTESINLTKGELKEALEKWIEDLQEGRPLNDSARCFLNAYPHFVIGNLIHLMVAVELFGTHDYGLSLDIIQDDIEEWAEDTILYKQMEKQQRNRIVLLSLFSLIIAYFSQSMLKKTGLQTQMELTNVSLLIFLMMIEITIGVVQQLLSNQWIERSEEIWRT